MGPRWAKPLRRRHRRLPANLQFADHGLAVRLALGELHHLTDEELRQLLVALAVAGPLVGMLFDELSHRRTERVRGELFETQRTRDTDWLSPVGQELGEDGLGLGRRKFT